MNCNVFIVFSVILRGNWLKDNLKLGNYLVKCLCCGVCEWLLGVNMIGLLIKEFTLICLDKKYIINMKQFWLS